MRKQLTCWWEICWNGCWERRSEDVDDSCGKRWNVSWTGWHLHQDPGRWDPPQGSRILVRRRDDHHCCSRGSGSELQRMTISGWISHEHVRYRQAVFGRLEAVEDGAGSGNGCDHEHFLLRLVLRLSLLLRRLLQRHDPFDCGENSWVSGIGHGVRVAGKSDDAVDSRRIQEYSYHC